MNSDREWQNLGEQNPYYGVFTWPEFDRGQPDVQARESFFSSGEDYVADVVGTIMRRFIHWARGYLPFGRPFANLLRGRSLNAALMQMHEYNLNHVFAILQDNGLDHTHVRLNLNWNYRSVSIFVQRDRAGQATQQAAAPERAAPR